MAQELGYVRLSREVRFGLQGEGVGGASRDRSDMGAAGSAGKGSSNSFAGEPMLGGLFPFVALTVTVGGPVDGRTGMLVNIKVIDALVRERAVGVLREYAVRGPLRIGEMGNRVFEALAGAMGERGHGMEGISLALSPYLRVAVVRQEKPMVRLSQRFEFSASHRLHAEGLSEAENLELFGRCNNPNGHGHNYELEVTIAGIPDGAGMLLPIAELQQIVNENVLDVFDHKHLNLDCEDFRKINPTVENIARVLYRRLKPKIPGPHALAAIRLWETPKTMCEYSE